MAAGEKHPYPSNVFVPSFVTVKLSNKNLFDVWKAQMLCLLESHDMLGFINENPPEKSDFGKPNVDDYKLWRRSDALVKGWILGSLSQKVLVNFVKRNTDFTAKDLWDGLQTIYGPPPPQAATDEVSNEIKEVEEEEERPMQEEISIVVNTNINDLKDIDKERIEEEKRTRLHQLLYEAIRRQKYQKALNILNRTKKKVKPDIKPEDKPKNMTEEQAKAKAIAEAIAEIKANVQVKVRDKIDPDGNTALHLVVGTTKKTYPLNEMLEMEPTKDLSNMRNSDGSTPLHIAAIVGNIEAARMLVEKDPELLFVEDNQKHTPLAKAVSNMHMNTYLCLYEKACDKEKAIDIFQGTSGDELLVNAISAKDYNSAGTFIKHYPNFHSDSVLMAMAQNFPRKVIGKTTYKRDDEDMIFALILAISIITSVFVLLLKGPFSGWIIYPLTVGAMCLSVFVMSGIYTLFKHNVLRQQGGFLEEGSQMHNDATRLLKGICYKIRCSPGFRSYKDYYKNPILEAARHDAYEVAVEIVRYFPNAILSTNKEGHNIIQHAVINRSDRVYNLLYQMSEHRNIYRTTIDPLGNNLLHLAARLAPPDKLKHISGAALQIQHELQWFKEVKGFVCPLNTIQKNNQGETPEEVFTREHEKLLTEGEKWMKATAKSYTITAALITTIMFASAITVPGGNNQSTGIPIFTNDTTFSIFAISDAVSLFASVTSLLMFLSILTTRFAEEDFLFSLPTKLIIGLTTLFISTTAMLVAFGATLFLVFGGRNSPVLIPIAALTCLPITSFVTLQFPLIADLVISTYGHSLFGKKSDEPFC